MVWSQKTDTLLVKDFKPTGIRFGTDVLSLIRNPVDDSFSGWEFSADVDFFRYYLVAETGHWQRNFSTDTEAYSNRGTYWRAGVDINFLKKDPERNMFFIGARYASGVFTENLTFALNGTWDSGTSTYANIDTKANWVELTGGLRVRVWRVLWLGYTARYKFALSTNEPSNMVPHDVPGYGKTDKKNSWGFNYQVLVRLPFKRETKSP